MAYHLPQGTRIGHVHLKVADLKRALAFYHELLGFEITQRYGDQAVFISAGGYHHHIGLNTCIQKMPRLRRCDRQAYSTRLSCIRKGRILQPCSGD